MIEQQVANTLHEILLHYDTLNEDKSVVCSALVQTYLANRCLHQIVLSRKC